MPASAEAEKTKKVRRRSPLGKIYSPDHIMFHATKLI